MLIVDAQIHIWRNNKPTNPNHRQVTDYTSDDVLREMDAGGVNAALIHPPGWDPNSNALSVEAAKRHPNRLAILGNFPLDKPESRTLIDGMKGRPGMLGFRFALIQPQLVAAAKFPNVALKATGAPSYSSEAYPYRDIHGHIRQLYDAFGPARMFWGTDITRMPCSWRQCVTMFTEELPWLSAWDKELIMGRAVCDWLGWNLPG